MLLSLLNKYPVITWCCVSVPEACSAFPSSVWMWAIRPCFIIFGTSFMLLEHQCLSLASSLHQPLLLSWLELKKMCANFLLFHVSYMRWDPPTTNENIIERHLQRNAWSNTALPSRKALQTHPLRHRENVTQVQLTPKGEGPTGFTFKLAPLKTPPDCSLWLRLVPNTVSAICLLELELLFATAKWTISL